MKKAVVLVGLVLLFVLLASCAPGPNVQVNTPDVHGVVAGFWRGLWHGIIAPITFIVSLFNDSIHMYDVHPLGRRRPRRRPVGAEGLLGEVTAVASGHPHDIRRASESSMKERSASLIPPCFRGEAPARGGGPCGARCGDAAA